MKNELIDKVMGSKSTQSIDTTLLEEVIGVLTQRFRKSIKIKLINCLSEPDRRNLVLRILLKEPLNGVPNSLILKQSKPGKSLVESKEFFGRFARDCAGLEFLTDLKIETSLAPQFYGFSQKYNFVLLEDLGQHVNLIDYLTGKDRKAAEEALKRFMQCMGQFHAESYQHIKNYSALLKKLNPNAEIWQDDLNEMLSKFSSLLEKLNVSLTTGLKREISHVFMTAKEHGPFTTLMHGDIGPSNVVDDYRKGKIYLIDFEWSFLGNALLDSTCLRMSNPTCWCVKAYLEEIIESLEEIYRKELMKKIPAASEDNLYYEAYVCACAYWIFVMLSWSVEKLLNQEYDISNFEIKKFHPNWKKEDNLRRPRVLSRLEAFVKIATKHNMLPNIKNTAEHILEELGLRWPDTKSLSLFSVFV